MRESRLHLPQDRLSLPELGPPAGSLGVHMASIPHPERMSGLEQKIRGMDTCIGPFLRVTSPLKSVSERRSRPNFFCTLTAHCTFYKRPSMNDEGRIPLHRLPLLNSHSTRIQPCRLLFQSTGAMP